MPREKVRLSMIQQAVEFDMTCTNCDRPGQGWMVQIVKSSKLRWEIDWVCESCGIAHAGGWGPAPENIRSALISEHGLICVHVPGDRNHRGKTLKAFRHAFGVSIQEAKAMADELAGAGWCGTRVEASLIMELLIASGVEVRESVPGESRAALLKKLQDASLEILEVPGIIPLGPTVSQAWQSVAGDVEPTAALPFSSPGRDIHTQWLHHARQAGIFDDEETFLVTVVTTGSHRVGWIHVKITPETDFSRLRDDQDCIEFIACSNSGDTICGVTAEEYDYWIVTFPIN
jgi:hypothetical protein